ncbi:MAG: VOC family protein [Pseudomonadales bacterium]|jgi:catechol 2,3-dioxygenase-like lactoylglutathione lyase family enzyme
MQRPGPTSGMRHVAIFVKDLEASEQFFVDLMGMQVEWRPDPDNVYLTSGNDNLALHRAPIERQVDRLDHIGFFIQTPELVDAWSDFLSAHQVELLTQPRTHRDGARSFYCLDPSGIKVQIIYHPPIAINDGLGLEDSSR